MVHRTQVRRVMTYQINNQGEAKLPPGIDEMNWDEHNTVSGKDLPPSELLRPRTTQRQCDQWDMSKANIDESKNVWEHSHK